MRYGDGSEHLPDMGVGSERDEDEIWMSCTCGWRWSGEAPWHASPPQPGHGYTCGWCAWGRDGARTWPEYAQHVLSTAHVGERRTPEAHDAAR